MRDTQPTLKDVKKLVRWLKRESNKTLNYILLGGSIIILFITLLILIWFITISPDLT